MRNKVWSQRFTEEEWAAIRRAAELADRTTSDWIRRTLLRRALRYGKQRKGGETK